MPAHKGVWNVPTRSRGAKKGDKNAVTGINDGLSDSPTEGKFIAVLAAFISPKVEKIKVPTALN